MNRYYGIIILLILTRTATFAQADEAAVTAVIHKLLRAWKRATALWYTALLPPT